MSRKMPKTQLTRLQKRLNATLIHGVTGREVQMEILEAGTYVTSWFRELDPLCQELNHFSASSDGKSWYHYQSYEHPFVDLINPKSVECDDGEVVLVSRSPKQRQRGRSVKTYRSHD